MTDTLRPPAFLDRRPLVYTYTNLHTYDDVCGYQFYRKYIVKDIPYVATPAMDYGNRVHEALELRIGGKKPLPVDFAQWESFAVPFDGKNVKVEQKIAITNKGRSVSYFDKEAWLRIRIDVVMLDGNRAFITDWKSGNSKYEDPFEIALNALCLKAANPSLEKVAGVYGWLKENRLSTVYDLSDFRGTWLKTKSIVDKIEQDRTTGQFEKKQSGLCGFCDVADCEYNRKPK